MDVQEYANELKKCIDKNRYYTLIINLGNQLNRPKDRFEKSDLIERSLENYSNGRLIYIDEDGRDFYDTEYKTYIELKYQSNCIFTEKLKQIKSIVRVKLKNSLGNHKGTNIMFPSDYYMIAQQDAMAIVEWKIAKQHLKASSDGIELHLPSYLLTFIFYPNEVSFIGEVDINYKQKKIELQDNIINGIPSL